GVQLLSPSRRHACEFSRALRRFFAPLRVPNLWRGSPSSAAACATPIRRFEIQLISFAAPQAGSAGLAFRHSSSVLPLPGLRPEVPSVRRLTCRPPGALSLSG